MGTHEGKRDSLIEGTAVGVGLSGGRRKKSPARLQGMQPGGMGEGNKNIPPLFWHFNQAILFDDWSNTCRQKHLLLPLRLPQCRLLPRCNLLADLGEVLNDRIN